MKNWWLYVLELEEGKYYVGITSQTPEIRMQEHLNQVRGAYWTKKYIPLRILYSEQLGSMEKDDAEAIENLSVRKYMKQFGLNNVRGGDMTKLDDYSKLFGYILFKQDADAFKIMISLILLNVFLLVAYILK